MTLGAEMQRATPTEKNLHRYLSNSFQKKMLRKSQTHLLDWIGWCQIGFGIWEERNVKVRF